MFSLTACTFGPFLRRARGGEEDGSARLVCQLTEIFVQSCFIGKAEEFYAMVFFILKFGGERAPFTKIKTGTGPLSQPPPSLSLCLYFFISNFPSNSSIKVQNHLIFFHMYNTYKCIFREYWLTLKLYIKKNQINPINRFGLHQIV